MRPAVLGAKEIGEFARNASLRRLKVENAHMRIKSSLFAILGGVSLVSMSSAAFAGGCASGVSAQNCQTGVVVSTGNAPVFDPMTVHINQPMGHLRNVQFNRAPNVSITRVHGMGHTAALEDAPSAFTGGCNPTSTHYCRGGDVRPAPAPQPYIAPPAPAPMMAAPVMAAPVIAQPVYQAPRTVYVGGGYDASKFQPRQYGNNTFTPGIAHLPTSYVDRSLGQNGAYTAGEFQQHRATAPAAPGIAPLVMPSIMNGVPVIGAPAMGMSNVGMSNMGVSMAQPVMSAPMMTQPAATPPMITGGLSAAPVNSGPVKTTTGLYASAVAPDGTYWEKTSGPTVFGSTIATQVICRRQLPTKTVRPVVGVPTAVPVPVALPVGCVPGPHAHPSGQMHGQLAGAPHGYAKKPAMGGRYGASGSRWTH